MIYCIKYKKKLFTSEKTKQNKPFQKGDLENT